MRKAKPTPDSIEALKILARQELARRNYVNYVEYVHDYKWIPAKHLVKICEVVESLINDNLYNDKGELVNCLIVTMPPQHGKSQTITETLPSYYLGKWPERRVIVVSYGDDLARRFGKRNKQKIQEYGKDLFGIRLAQNSRSDTDFEIDKHKGTVISRGIMAGITGQPGELVIIDDVIKNRSEAESKVFRDKIYEEFLSSVVSRLSAKGKIINIQTRWHEDDLAGRLISENKFKLFVLNLPCEAEENDILGRKLGDALFPEIGKNNEWLQDYKKIYSSENGYRTWLALYQGRPTAQEGNMVKRDWWKWYKETPKIMRKIISVDAAFKDGAKNDFVAIQCWGKTNSNMYLLDRVKARMDFPTTIQAIRAMKAKHSDSIAVYIEDKANGSAIISVLRNEIGGVIPVEPYGSKEARVSAISPQIEAGNVYLPDPSIAPWIHDFVEEWAAFPNGKNDDEVDCGSQAINKLRTVHATYVLLEDTDEPTSEQKYNQFVKDVTGGSIPKQFFDFTI